MLNVPLVSVVVPHFNNSCFLADCLESICFQTYKNVEIIIVDDGSNDDERDQAERIASEYKCDFIVNPVNRGVSHTRNRGLRMARGDVLTTIDPDDFFVSPDYISMMVEGVEKNPNAVFGGRAVYYDIYGQLVSKKITKNIMSGHLKIQILSRSCYIPINIFYSKNLLLGMGGYDETLSAYEDWDFKIRLSADHEFIVLPAEVGYRIHGKGLSTLKRREKVKRMFRVFYMNKGVLRLGEIPLFFLYFSSCFFYNLKSVLLMKKF